MQNVQMKFQFLNFSYKNCQLIHNFCVSKPFYPTDQEMNFIRNKSTHERLIVFNLPGKVKKRYPISETLNSM